MGAADTEVFVPNCRSRDLEGKKGSGGIVWKILVSYLAELLKEEERENTA